MKIIEKTLIVLAILSLVLKFSLLSGGDYLLMISLLSLSCLYYAFGFLFFNHIKLRNTFKKQSYQGISGLRIFGGVGIGMALATICVGLIFKLLSLTGGDQMLIIGVITALVPLAISIFKFIQRKDAYYSFILWRVLIFTVLGFVLFLTPKMTIFKMQYGDHPQYIEAYVNLEKDPNNPVLQEKFEIERYRILLSEEEFKIYMKNLER